MFIYLFIFNKEGADRSNAEFYNSGALLIQTSQAFIVPAEKKALMWGK